MTDKIRNLLEDVRVVYEGKGMVVYPSSFDRLRMEVIKLDNINVQQSEQLTKAKEVIKKFSEFTNNEVDYDPEHPQEYTDLWHKLCKEAEQFLKETE